MPGANGYDFLVEAVRILRWDDNEGLADLFFPSFTDRSPPGLLSDNDVSRMDTFVHKNHAAIELVDKSIASPQCITPPIVGCNALAPAIAAAINTMSRIGDLELICYIEARSLIHHGRWNGAIKAIDRLFRFGDMLINAWQDFGLPVFGTQTKRRACQAILEMSLCTTADQAIVMDCLRLVHTNTVAADTFFEAWTRPFWRTIARFLDSLGIQADALAAVQYLLQDTAVRHVLTSRRSKLSQMDGIAEAPLLYPAVTGDDERELQNALPSVAMRWISQECDVPFDTGATVRILDDALAAIDEQRASGTISLRNYLDSVTSKHFPACRLVSLLRAASAGSGVEIKQLLSDILAVGEGRNGSLLPRNIIGIVMATDIISACHFDLSLACLSWQLSRLDYEVCRTAIAITAYSRSHGSPPQDLGELEARGYLDGLPRDSFRGEPLKYDREQQRLFVSADVSSAIRCGASLDHEPEEISWYLH